MHNTIYWKGQEINPDDIDPDILYLIESFLFNKINSVGNHTSYSKERARLRLTLFGEKSSEEYIDDYLCTHEEHEE